jgi:hypothetical protein
MPPGAALDRNAKKTDHTKNIPVHTNWRLSVLSIKLFFNNTCTNIITLVAPTRALGTKYTNMLILEFALFFTEDPTDGPTGPDTSLPS